MTTMSQGNKKIITRKIPAMNNKVLVLTGSLHVFKKYRQPVIKFWSVLVPVRETVRNKMHLAALLYLTTVQLKKQIISSQVTIIQFNQAIISSMLIH